MSKEVKMVRGQLRQIAAELLPELLKDAVISGAVSAHIKEQESNLTARLDKIEDFCKDNLSKQDARAKSIQGFLVNTVMNDIKDFTNKTYVTMLAWQELMAEKLGADAEFQASLEAKKKEVSERLVAAATKNMEDSIQKEAK